MTSKYIVFDGLDGSGKDTQRLMLTEYLIRAGYEDKFITTREPGGVRLSEEIRSLVLSEEAKEYSPLTQFLLMWAAREESIRKKVLPALISGKHVISNRSDSSTWAFQIYGEERQQLRHLFSEIRKEVFSEEVVTPSLYIFFDLPPKVAYERMQKDRDRSATHFDERPIEYHTRVRDGFHSFSRRYRSCIIDANRPADIINEEVKKVVLDEFDR